MYIYTKQNHLECKKCKADQKQQLFDYKHNKKFDIYLRPIKNEKLSYRYIRSYVYSLLFQGKGLMA